MKEGRANTGLDRLDYRLTGFALRADPVWVDPDLQTLWEAATPSFDVEALHPQDLITESGFVYLPRPLFTTDVHGKRTCFRAFGWEVGDVVYNVEGKDDDAERQEYRLRGPILYFFHQVGDIDEYDNGIGPVPQPELDEQAIKDGLLDPEFRDKVRKWSDVGLRTGDLTIDHVMPWVYGESADGSVPIKEIADGRFVYDNERAGLTMDAPIKHVGTKEGDVRRPVQCLWRLMQQTIVTHGEAKAGGQFRRRWERENLKPKGVTVIKLRRPRAPTPDGHESHEVEWSHRWLVSGHWRNQWYPSINGHRQIWISPYIKGPEDAPLELRKLRVFELVR